MNNEVKKNAHNRIDMIGKRYNSWLVLAYSHTQGKIAYYLAKCMSCNTDHVIQGGNVRIGSSKRCVECGVKNSSKLRTGTRKSRNPAHQMKVEYLYKAKKKSALQRDINWDLNIEQFESLIFAPCFYSGLPPSTAVNILKNNGLHSTWGDEGIITYNGLDRIDSSKGYVLGNVVTANSKVNCAKNDDTTEEFLAWVKAIAVHQGWIK